MDDLNRKITITTFYHPNIRIQFQIVKIQNQILMTAYPNEIIKDNYVQELDLQIASFAGFEYGGRKSDLGFWRRTPKSGP